MTIYDIAAEAGVSASTVSRVMNNKKGVNPAKRKEIEALLTKYHFEPNASAQGLVNQSSKIIGIMVSDIRTSHHAEGAYYVEQHLRNEGYSSIIVNSGFSNESRDEGFRLLVSRRAEALVLIGSTFQMESVKGCIQKYFADRPVVIENGQIDLPNVYSVLSDEQNGISESLRLLYQQGRTNPYYINMYGTPSNQLKIQGFLAVWHEKNLFTSAQPPVVNVAPEPGENDWTACYNAVKDLIAGNPDIDAMIFSTDLLANAGTRALTESGIKVPEQVAVIGVDNSIYSTLSYPPLTVVDNKMQDLSKTCADMLLRLLNGESVEHKVVIPVDIIERDST